MQLYNTTLQSNFIEIALRHGCSPVNSLHIFRTPFPLNIFGRLLQKFISKVTCKVTTQYKKTHQNQSNMKKTFLIYIASM